MIKYILVRTYGNGKYMNEVYPKWFEYLSQAETVCGELNKIGLNGSAEKWIPMPIIKYYGDVWKKQGKKI